MHRYLTVIMILSMFCSSRWGALLYSKVHLWAGSVDQALALQVCPTPDLSPHGSAAQQWLMGSISKERQFGIQAVEQRAREARKVADEAACEVWNSLAPRPFMLSPVICSSCLPRSGSVSV